MKQTHCQTNKKSTFTVTYMYILYFKCIALSQFEFSNSLDCPKHA